MKYLETIDLVRLKEKVIITIEHYIIGSFISFLYNGNYFFLMEIQYSGIIENKKSINYLNVDKHK